MNTDGSGKERRFAEACATHAKTDAVDARTLARKGEALGPEPDQPTSHKLLNLKDLQIARIGLAKDRTRLRKRGHMQTNPVLKRQIKTRLALVERQITDLDAEIAKYIAEDQSTARKRDILCSMPGLGPISAAMIIAFPPEIGTLERKQAASIAGLAPYNRESGMWKGRSVIRGGRKPLRDVLYMPGPGRHAFQPRSSGEILPAPRHRKTGKGRHRSHHAKAPHHCKRIAP